MKRHTVIENDVLMENLCDEVNDAEDIKPLSLILQLYIEYFISELIRLKFNSPKIIIDNNELGSFSNRLNILCALDIFEKKESLLRNIKIINRIRNYYAHNLIIDNSRPSEIVNRIRELVNLDFNGEIIDFDCPLEELKDPVQDQLHICGVSTISALQSLAWNLEK